MKTDNETIRDSFHLGYDEYYESRVEANSAWDMYHNRQWTDDQEALLTKRGQPKETFNVIKLFARMLVGYYSTVMNTVRAEPQQFSDSTSASLVTDTINVIFETNSMDVEGDKIKLSGMVSGLMCAQVEPYFTGERDQFGRPLYSVRLGHVPDHELVLDPMSTDENYDDARFLHRFKWVPQETVAKAFGKAALDKIDENYNHLEVDEAEYQFSHQERYLGRYKVFDNYLIVHTVIEDDNGKRWSIFWCGDIELQRKEITFRNVKWTYRIVKLHSSNQTEYYGIFREVLETQKAINQALVKIQLMVNTQKIFVEKNAVGNINEFTSAVNRVNGVIEVKSLKGVRVENLAKEALEQYVVIDKALDRIQRLLSVNDSFLGMAYASDSGRKVKLQQNATIMALRYLTVRIESFYKLLGTDIAFLIQQFYTANQVLRVSDEIVGNRFIELNKPMQIFTGQMDNNGQPIYEYAFEQVMDPDTGEPQENGDGQLVFAPIPEDGTELTYTKVDIKIETVAYNDEDERSQLMIETILSGNMGQMLSQVNPSGFFKIAGLTLRSMKTKYSPEISKIFEDTAAMLSQNPEEEDAAATVAQGAPNLSSQQPKSQANKLPTNTNEVL